MEMELSFPHGSVAALNGVAHTYNVHTHEIVLASVRVIAIGLIRWGISVTDRHKAHHFLYCMIDSATHIVQSQSFYSSRLVLGTERLPGAGRTYRSAPIPGELVASRSENQHRNAV